MEAGSVADMSYLPRQEPELAAWAAHFLTKLTTHATSVDVSAAALATLKDDVAFLSYLLLVMVPAYRAKAQEVTAYKDLVKDGPAGAAGGTVPVAPTLPKSPTVVVPGVIPRIQSLVQRIKNAPGYTEAIGRDLGIVGPTADQAVADHEKPTFKAVALADGRVRLDWVKGKADGVRVESRRGNEAEWTVLGDDRFSPFHDARPSLTPGQSEYRFYRLMYLKKDNLVGEYSDMVSATTIV